MSFPAWRFSGRHHVQPDGAVVRAGRGRSGERAAARTARYARLEQVHSAAATQTDAQ